jgi:hypothetical protein
MLNDLLYRLRALLRRQEVENEMEEELRFHLECEAARNRKFGLASGDAHQIARRAFGGMEQTREECRDARGTRVLEDVLQDCRYAIRMIRKNAAFSTLVVFTLALSIGANTAVFSIVHEVILKPLPFRDPSRLLAVWDTIGRCTPKSGYPPWNCSPGRHSMMFSNRQPGTAPCLGMGICRFPGRRPRRFMRISFLPICFHCWEHNR